MSRIRSLGEVAVSEVILIALMDNGFNVARLTDSLLEIEGNDIRYQVQVRMIAPEFGNHVGAVATSALANVGDSVAAATEDVSDIEPSYPVEGNDVGSKD